MADTAKATGAVTIRMGNAVDVNLKRDDKGEAFIEFISQSGETFELRDSYVLESILEHIRY